MVDTRIAERRAQVRREERSRRLRRTVLVASLLALLGIAYAIERSPLVALAEVRVQGAQRLDPSEVRRAAGLSLGTSTLRLRLAQVEARVEALPLVAEATARRLDPLTVLITVEERRPALVARRGERRVMLDASGRILAEGGEPGLVPILVLGEGGLPAPGEGVGSEPALAGAHRAWIGLSGPLRAEVVRLVARAPDEIDLVLARGTTVRLGRPDRLDEKVRALGSVLEDVGDRAVTVIDVRAPAAPVVVP